jgi:hypothetical protein
MSRTGDGKGKCKKSITPATVANGTENPELELKVIHQFSFCAVPCGFCRVFGLWQGSVTDPSSPCAYRRKE